MLFDREGIKREELIPANWNISLQSKSLSGLSKEYLERIIKRQGITLEIACGPGGGTIVEILTNCSSARILMNDIGPWMLQDWKGFISVQSPNAKVSFSQFDVTRCPIFSGSFDCVSSSGGFSNIEHNVRVFIEVYRIRKPGGLLLMSDCIPDPESFERLPEQEKKEWLSKFPDTRNGYEMRLKSIGFKIIEIIETGKQVLDPKESTLAEMGSKYGILLI